MSETTNGQVAPLDIAGVGVGPANLSLAALLHPVSGVRSRFFDARGEFRWHPGLMLPDATINVSFLKDLVTLADPTSKFSFLCFLHCQRDIYSFINANFDSVTRREFNEYLQWACAQIESLEFGTSVETIEFDGEQFQVHTGSGVYAAKNIVLGTGQRWFLPPCVEPFVGERVYHAANYMNEDRNFAGQRVAVVGGGQTGAELVLSLLTHPTQMPKQVIWISRRGNFHPLDDSAFANELYTPEYSDHFGSLPFDVRKHLLAEQKMTSDGINISLLQRIYQRLYEIRYLDKSVDRWRLCPARELIAMRSGAGGYELTMRQHLSEVEEQVEVDYVICATGMTRMFPAVLEPIRERVQLEEDELIVGDDYSIAWDGPADNRIYVQNAARAARGVADPNLSLNAWRAARIINSLTGRTVYDVDGSSSMVDWGPNPTAGYARRVPGGRRSGAQV